MCGILPSISRRVSKMPSRYGWTDRNLCRPNQIKAFVASIDEGAICHLASQHNDRKPCNITRQSRGSFNVCFFARFGDSTTLVVRIPLEPVVDDSWTKVQSEVATMRYLKLKTRIPVPHVHAYGQTTQLTKDGSTTTTFMISEFIPGQTIRLDDVKKTTKERRRRFLDDLTDVLVELRQLEFPAAGSLMPNPDDESEPVVDGFLSMAMNELQVDRGRKCSLSSFSSAEAFMDYQYAILSNSCEVPSVSLDQQVAEEELFILHTLAERIPQLLNPRWSNGPFILTHLDLTCGNIVVDEDLHIIGIIDGEFAGTVPLQYFTPPLWVTGHSRPGLIFPSMDPIIQDFKEALQAKSATSEGCAQLMREWNWNTQQESMFPMVQILRRPHTLLRVYRAFINKGDYKENVANFFEHHSRAKDLVSVAERRVESSNRYTRYLEDHGLLVIDEEAEQKEAEFIAILKEGIAKAKAIQEDLEKLL
ncbi:hypothetical protein SODALDRAFT_342666 [Sodiomyces alkalinus F11]|uniref:Aminoglycoside phosphotransferase domain-containing protein n=1 Tax=Sodiomyces alkalinus (strain CBS 110278 / VKM F-3762 / F11) TaxID=1314773 RepID=A0A3N2QAQ1_SODAK|nr:hypothetical protein SODALDRAFT_342666 [Sodiomyces alkalinus F11]ROT43830.1 hypothetical protein SODALDRAFT_342666 [Sodiomyces alkalinus F11]